jgi:predicted transport protein
MDPAVKTMIENLHKNTGKTLEQWIEIVKKSGFAKHGEVIRFLKEKHAFTHGFANLVAHKAKGSDAGSAADPTDLVENQYNGKEALRPFYDQLIEKIKTFGADVELAPKNAYVSLRRKKQFALIQPSTKSRLDIGLNIKDLAPAGKLEASGSFNSMCTHRIRIESIDDLDKAVYEWLKAAYDRAG